MHAISPVVDTAVCLLAAQGWGAAWHLLQHVRSAHSSMLRQVEHAASEQLQSDSFYYCRQHHTLASAQQARPGGVQAHASPAAGSVKSTANSRHPAPRSSGSSNSSSVVTEAVHSTVSSQHHSPDYGTPRRHSNTQSSVSPSSSGSSTTRAMPAPGPTTQQDQHSTASSNTTATSSSSSSRSSSPSGYMAVRAALRQVPDAPGTPSRPHHAPHIAARHHLQQYLASIDRSSFVDDLAAGIWAGNRLAISRSLTLCESTRPDHALQAAALLRKLIDNRQQQLIDDRQQQLAQEPHSNSSSSSSDSGGQQLEDIGEMFAAWMQQ